MAEGLAAQPTDEPFVSSIPTAVHTHKETFAQMLKVKLEQGYCIESQGDTEAVLFTPDRRRWFGLFAGRGRGDRQTISIDDQGVSKTRKLSSHETIQSRGRKKPLVS
jgi:hypothetical protein